MCETSDSSCDVALARGVIYRLLSEAFRYPGGTWHAEWRALSEGARAAARTLCEENQSSHALRTALEGALAAPFDADSIKREHAHVIGHVPRAAATPYETEWTGVAGELLQYHQLSDIAAFYNAFGLELGRACDERADHVSVELEFMHYLCVKEAWARDQRLDDLAAVCRATENAFLSEHLARWTRGLCARLETASGDGFYALLATLLRLWVEDECRCLGAEPSESALEFPATSFRPEDACIGCGHAAACMPELKGAVGVDARV